RIHFHEIRDAVAVATHVDACDIAQTESFPDRERDRGDAGVVDEAVIDAILVVAFDLDRVEEILFLLLRDDLHHRDDLSAENADGVFVARQIFFDQRRAVHPDARDRLVELRFASAKRFRGDTHRGAFRTGFHKEGVTEGSGGLQAAVGRAKARRYTPR